MPGSPPSPHPTSGHLEHPLTPPTNRTSQRRPWLPLILVTTIIAGGIGVLGTFLFVRPDTGQDDATIACNAVDRIGFPLDEDEFRTDTPLIHQLSGISSFAGAAAVGDDAHAELEGPRGKLFTGLQRADVDMINNALQQISTVCGDIGY